MKDDEPSESSDEETYVASDDTESLAETGQVESGDSVDTERWTQVQQAHYDRNQEEELTTTLVFAIAAAKGVDPLDHDAMPPIYESIDVQSLEDAFFGPSGADTQRSQAGAVNFQYDGLTISLRADGWISVYEPQ